MPLSAESKHGDLWINLQERHAGHRFLKQNPLYTLKTDLIHAIKSECPNFFSTADERFEFDLAQTAHHGFFCHLPIGNNFNQSAIPEQIEPPPEASSGGFLPSRIEAFAPKEAEKLVKLLRRQPESTTIEQFIEHARYPLEWTKELLERLAPKLKPTASSDRSAKASIGLINDYLADVWIAAGRSAKNIAAAHAQAERESKLMHNRLEAFAGWLVTDQYYQKELASLVNSRNDLVLRMGRFPDDDDEPDATTKLDDEWSAFRIQYQAFLRRWCLEKMLTWELPIPASPIVAADATNSQCPPCNGIQVFLPWYMVRGEQFNLQDLVRRVRFESTPDHLRDWVLKTEGKHDDETGDLAFQRTFWVYRTYELVLRRRYPAACKRNIQALDRAMARVMDRSTDLVKRLRQRMTRSVAL